MLEGLNPKQQIYFEQLLITPREFKFAKIRGRIRLINSKGQLVKHKEYYKLGLFDLNYSDILQEKFFTN